MAPNSAFVFVKPHAVTEAAKTLVKEGLLAAGMKITSEGSLSAEEIDSKKLIDQHYYAIASKATILKPAELNVPGDKFEAQFGLTWEAALAAGNVYNAMDACSLLGITADEMDAQWGICKKAKKLVKFGGGFYCGLIEMAGKPPLYVFNGFFMSMRSKFTAPGVSIYYFTVEWDESALSWADFRGQLLGPTDPAECPATSLRGKIKAQWSALGLAAEPDVGDNGVHASASPFEALAERLNWCGATLDRDSFGSALLSAGIPASMLKAWAVDPQVLLPGGGGKKGSLFDALEDTNASDCLAKCVELAAANTPAVKNSAFVFVKPHAVTEAAKTLVKEGLLAAGMKITSEGSLSAEEIDSKKLIDQHYYAIASKATILKPAELNVPGDKFEAQFGLTWEAALAAGNVYNAMDACSLLGITADEMDAQWGICKKAKKLVKFGGGFYCGLIEMAGKPPLYVFNGFFMSMRSKFTAPGVSIYYFTVEWDESALSWADFRGQLLGPTDPAECPATSLRGKIKAQWSALGLAAEPDVGDNGVHASASPLEALAERLNWCGATLDRDSFGSALLGAGIPASMLKAWAVDPQVLLPGGAGKKGSLFDALEDMNASDCVLTCRALCRANVDSLYLQDGPEAKEIASVIPYYPFKGIPRFYDIGGFLKNPAVFQKIVDIFVDRYKALDVDSIGGLDARGFVLGPPIALALGKPFFMLRKKGKMPNCNFSAPYKVEYGERDGLGIPKDAVKKGDRVLLIDDLVATGGTLSAGIECIKMSGASVVECACIVEIKFFIAQRAKFYEALGIADVPIWALVSEEILDIAAPVTAEYKDDGEEH